MYTQDSFFTLSAAGQIGLGLLSVALAVALIWGCWRITRRMRRLLSLAVAVLVLWLFIWLSPQVYYGYYLLIFDGLPLQIVVQEPPSPLRLLRVLFFADRGTLSAHGQGILGWLTILGACLKMPHRSELTRP